MNEPDPKSPSSFVEALLQVGAIVMMAFIALALLGGLFGFLKGLL
jgi:hypothetical protein